MNISEAATLKVGDALMLPDNRVAHLVLPTDYPFSVKTCPRTGQDYIPLTTSMVTAIPSHKVTRL